MIKEPMSVNARVNAITKRIRSIRENRGFSQQYMATKLNISANAYSKIELRQSKIYLDRLFQIATILNINIETLLNK